MVLIKKEILSKVTNSWMYLGIYRYIQYIDVDLHI